MRSPMAAMAAVYLALTHVTAHRSAIMVHRDSSCLNSDHRARRRARRVHTQRRTKSTERNSGGDSSQVGKAGLGSNALIAILVVVVLLAFAGGIILGRRRT